MQARGEPGTRDGLKAAPATHLKRELDAVEVQVCEQEMRIEALASVREDARQRVAELCSRVAGPDPAPVCQPSGAAPAVRAASEGFCADTAPGVALALQRVHEGLARLVQGQALDVAAAPAPCTPEPVAPLRIAQPAAGSAGGTGRNTALWHDSVDEGPSILAAQQHVAWLRRQREELLQSCLYGEGDAVMRAIDVQITEAKSRCCSTTP